MSERAAGVTEDPIRQAAADSLADLLKGAADTLAARGRRPERVPYGRGGAGLIKRRSPRGFVLNPSAPQLLLPDGRLWTFHTRRSPEGTYYDARVDHTRSMHGPIPLGDERFSFLGAVVDKYNFGYRHSDDEQGSPELGAIVGTGGLPQFVGAVQALDDVLGKL